MSSLQRNRWGVNIRQTKWGIVAQSTPRGFKNPRSEQELKARNTFRLVTWLIKYVDATQKLLADQYAHGRALYPRDVLMSAAYGKLYAIYSTPVPPDVGNYVLLDQKQPTSGQQTITFDNITDVYQDLIVTLTGGGRATPTSGQVNVRFNGDVSAHYSDQRDSIQSSTTTFLGRTALQTEASIGSVPGTTTGTSEGANIELTIPAYANTNFKKVARSVYTFRNAANAWVLTAGFNGIFWNQTAAISKIEIFTASVTGFEAFTVATLYGRGEKI